MLLVVNLFTVFSKGLWYFQNSPNPQYGYFQSFPFPSRVSTRALVHSTMFSFTSLQSESNKQHNGLPVTHKTKCLSQEVHQSLLSFPPDIKILIDVGWDVALATSLDHLIELAPSIDLLLLTHATVSHLGAYAYLCKVSPEFAAIPVYSTLPVINMGRMVTLDYYRSKGLLGPLQDERVTLSDVENAFDNITSLKYSQSTNLQDRLEGFVITPYNAGHTLGGTIWKIQHEQESVLYAVDWNHAKDSHLNGAFLQAGKLVEAFSRPSVMICGSKISNNPGTLEKRKEALFKDIQNTIQDGGSVLIPTSSGARVLELCHILDSFWEEQRISTPLIYYSHVGFRTMSYAKSMLEWMSPAIISEWEIHNNSPFDTKHLQIYSNLDDLAELEGPKVILASGEALETGFSRGLFTKICSASNSLVVLTERAGGPDSLNGQLYSEWAAQRADSDGSKTTNPVQLTTQLMVDYAHETPLTGEDLLDYNDKIREEKHKKELQSAIELRNKTILEEEEEVESSDDEEDELVLSGQMDTGILIYGQGVYDYDMRVAPGQPKGKPKMFPFVAKRRRIDEYGEIIKSDMFSTKAKDREDLVGEFAPGRKLEDEDMQDAKVGDKRQWGSVSQGDGKAGGAGGAGGAGVAADSDESTKLDSFSSAVVPKRVVLQNEDVKVLCSVDFIDFEGLTDDRSMQMIVPLVQPKQLIFLPSILDYTSSAKDSSRSNAMVIDVDDNNSLQTMTNVETAVDFFTSQVSAIEKIYKAEPNHQISMQIGSSIYKVTVAPELERLLKWQKIVGNYNVAHVTGKLVHITRTEDGAVGDDNKPKIEDVKSEEQAAADVKEEPNSDEIKTEVKSEVKTEDGETKPNVDTDAAALVPTPKSKPPKKQQQKLMLMPLQTARELAAAPRANPLMVGDIKLSELKHRLFRQHGLRAVFGAEGILVVANKVAVRKLSEGNIVIEGIGMDEEFYRVKALVRSMLALV